MLAYVFWHRRRDGVEDGEYERAQTAFHAAIGAVSACFRLDSLPFGDREGYEDWYLVDDWGSLGELNRAAVDAQRRGEHDAAAGLAADGWGSVYELVRGIGRIPDGAEWREKPRGADSAEFLESLPPGAVWRRQLALGPGPEFCLERPRPTPGRRQLS